MIYEVLDTCLAPISSQLARTESVELEPLESFRLIVYIPKEGALRLCFRK